MKSLVEIKGTEPMTDSRILSEAFGLEHRLLMKLIDSHKEQIEHFGVLHLESVKPKTGRPMTIAILNERQSLILLTYTRSRKETDYLRIKLIEDFDKAKKALMEISLNRKNQEWLTNRDEGKLQRKSTTDIIQKFVDYANSQGSKSAKMYYMNISKMENKALFLIQQKFPNLRDVMNSRQLSFVKSADIIVEEAIREGMEKEMFYKDIYKLCRERVESFSDLIPRTSIPMMISD
jgi:phage regulator Rha-like protein